MCDVMNVKTINEKKKKFSFPEFYVYQKDNMAVDYSVSTNIITIIECTDNVNVVTFNLSITVLPPVGQYTFHCHDSCSLSFRQH